MSLLSLITVAEISSHPVAHVFSLAIMVDTSSLVHGVRKMELTSLVGIYDKGSFVGGGIFLSREAPTLVK